MVAAFTLMVVLYYSNLQVIFPFESWGIVGIGAAIQLGYAFYKGA